MKEEKLWCMPPAHSSQIFILISRTVRRPWNFLPETIHTTWRAPRSFPNPSLSSPRPWIISPHKISKASLTSTCPSVTFFAVAVRLRLLLMTGLQEQSTRSFWAHLIYGSISRSSWYHKSKPHCYILIKERQYPVRFPHLGNCIQYSSRQSRSCSVRVFTLLSIRKKGSYFLSTFGAAAVSKTPGYVTPGLEISYPLWYEDISIHVPVIR